jgi:GR25 family glycosyltransferase involved in LPS biosynthesis
MLKGMKGFYINLDERSDRMQHFENMKVKYDFFKNIERMSAIKNSDGAIGCGMSHIKALTKLLEYEGDDDHYFMVCEDDLCILNNNNYDKFVNDFYNMKDKKWDIIVLTPRGDKMPDPPHHNFYRIHNNQTATAYIIKKTFISILITSFKQSIIGLLKGGNPNTYAIDQWWKRLQDEYVFYYYKDIYAGQLAGYSNIEHKHVNYNERFLTQ